MPVESESHLCARVHIRHPWVCSDECMSAACSLVHWCMTPRHCSRSGVRLRPPYGISPTSFCRHFVLWYNNTVGRFASGYLLSQSRHLADPRVTAIRVAHSCCGSNAVQSSHLFARTVHARRSPWDAVGGHNAQELSAWVPVCQRIQRCAEEPARLQPAHNPIHRKIRRCDGLLPSSS
jgi:hypothetical protein